MSAFVGFLLGFVLGGHAGALILVIVLYRTIMKGGDDGEDNGAYSH